MLQLYMHLASSRLACRDIQRIQRIQPIQLYSYTRYTAYSTIQRPSVALLTEQTKRAAVKREKLAAYLRAQAISTHRPVQV